MTSSTNQAISFPSSLKRFPSAFSVLVYGSLCTVLGALIIFLLCGIYSLPGAGGATLGVSLLSSLSLTQDLTIPSISCLGLGIISLPILISLSNTYRDATHQAINLPIEDKTILQLWTSLARDLILISSRDEDLSWLRQHLVYNQQTNTTQQENGVLLHTNELAEVTDHQTQQVRIPSKNLQSLSETTDHYEETTESPTKSLQSLTSPISLTTPTSLTTLTSLTKSSLSTLSQTYTSPLTTLSPRHTTSLFSSHTSLSLSKGSQSLRSRPFVTKWMSQIPLLRSQAPDPFANFQLVMNQSLLGSPDVKQILSSKTPKESLHRLIRRLPLKRKLTRLPQVQKALFRMIPPWTLWVKRRWSDNSVALSQIFGPVAVLSNTQQTSCAFIGLLLGSSSLEFGRLIESLQKSHALSMLKPSERDQLIRLIVEASEERRRLQSIQDSNGTVYLDVEAKDPSIVLDYPDVKTEAIVADLMSEEHTYLETLRLLNAAIAITTIATVICLLNAWTNLNMCCLAQQTKNPQQHLRQASFSTLSDDTNPRLPIEARLQPQTVNRPPPQLTMENRLSINSSQHGVRRHGSSQNGSRQDGTTVRLKAGPSVHFDKSPRPRTYYKVVRTQEEECRREEEPLKVVEPGSGRRTTRLSPSQSSRAFSYQTRFINDVARDKN